MRHLLLTVAVLAASASGGAGQVALRDGHLYRDGQLWVPKLLYHARDFAAAARQGFDLVMPKAFSDPRETTVAPEELAAIHAAGLHYCFSVANPILFDEAHGIQRPWDEGDLEWILPILNRYKDDPLLAFYYVDEPIGSVRYWWQNGDVGIYYDRLVKLRAWLQRYDPSHPLWVNFDPAFIHGGGGHSGREWVQNTADVVSMDLYPFRTGPVYGATGLGLFRTQAYVLGALKEYARPEQPVLNVIQAWACKRDDFVRPEETRATFLLSAALGVAGYAAYSASEGGDAGYTLAEAYPEVWAELGRINRIIDTVGMAVATGKAYRLEARRDLGNYRADCGLFATVYTAADGRQFLVAMNVREDIPFNDVTLTCPEWRGLADGALEAVSLFGGERVLLAGGVFRRSFGPAAGDVYEVRRQAE